MLRIAGTLGGSARDVGRVRWRDPPAGVSRLFALLRRPFRPAALRSAAGRA
jgi:hypothetical protein